MVHPIIAFAGSALELELATSNRKSNNQITHQTPKANAGRQRCTVFYRALRDVRLNFQQIPCKVQNVPVGYVWVDRNFQETDVIDQNEMSSILETLTPTKMRVCNGARTIDTDK